jgi:hypothetical protein
VEGCETDHPGSIETFSGYISSAGGFFGIGRKMRCGFQMSDSDLKQIFGYVEERGCDTENRGRQDMWKV